MTTNIRFSDWLTEQLTDPEFREAYEDLEAAYQVARLRMLKGLTQAELAELAGTKQSSIARLESGKSQPRLSFLRHIIQAMGGRLELHVYAEGETVIERTKTVTIPVTPIYVLDIHENQVEFDYDLFSFTSSSKLQREHV